LINKCTIRTKDPRLHIPVWEETELTRRLDKTFETFSKVVSKIIESNYPKVTSWDLNLVNILRAFLDTNIKSAMRHLGVPACIVKLLDKLASIPIQDIIDSGRVAPYIYRVQ